MRPHSRHEIVGRILAPFSARPPGSIIAVSRAAMDPDQSRDLNQDLGQDQDPDQVAEWDRILAKGLQSRGRVDRMRSCLPCNWRLRGRLTAEAPPLRRRP